MEMAKIMLRIPRPLKAKLDALRTKGYTLNGYIRQVLERELKHAPVGRKGR